MSRKRDALRRGIRSLIHDTSREMADFEGRPRPPDTEARPEPHDVSSRPTAAGEPGGPPSARPTQETLVLTAGAVAEPARRPPDGPIVEAAPPGTIAPAREAGRKAPPPIRLRPAETVSPVGTAPGQAELAADRGAAWIVGPEAPAQPPSGPEPVGRPSPPMLSAHASQPQTSRSLAPMAPRTEPVPPTVVRTPQIVPRPAAGPARRPVVSAPPSAQPPKALRPPRAAGVARGRRAAAARAAASKPGRASGGKRTAPKAVKPAMRGRRVAKPFAPNGVNPEQAHSRKGVCFAYFVNHECWRVPDAYCNTALQVCVLRNCPVYHLHQDALERRFAGKYKHFW